MKSFILILTVCVFGLIQCESRANSTGSQPPAPAPKTIESSAPEAKPEATPKPEKMDKQTLAKKVEPIDSVASAVISDKTAQVQPIAATFLKNGIIHKASKFAPTRPIVIYVGSIEPDYTSVISAAPEKYFEFVRRAGLIESNNEARVAYLLNYLEVTNSGKRLQILNSVDEIKQRPNLNDDQKAQFEEFREKFRAVITAPKQSADGSYDVFAIKGQDLVKLNLTIKEDKSIEKTETVIEKNLLVPYAL